jgi:hypothetical protein
MQYNDKQKAASVEIAIAAAYETSFFPSSNAITASL